MTEGFPDGIYRPVSEAKDLNKLLESIFEDGIVEPEERQELAAFTQSLPRDDVSKTFVAFLKAKWGEVIADDVITGAERVLMGKILMELELALEDLPHQAQVILKNHV